MEGKVGAGEAKSHFGGTAVNRSGPVSPRAGDMAA